MHGWSELLAEWPLHELAERLGISSSYNVAPSRLIAALPIVDGEIQQPQAMRWGMIPAWSKSFESRYATFNARSESVAEKPTFRNAWKHSQRCLIPMAGYYEWRSTNSEPSQKPSKQPVYISDPNSGVMLAAGLYEPWGNRGDVSCTMLTRSANEALSPIHPRMPVLLTSETASTWMNADNDELGDWLLDAPQPELLYWPVAKAVGNVRNDTSKLIEAIDV